MADTRLQAAPHRDRAGPLALVTIDNGEDHTKPTVFGRAALGSLARHAATRSSAATGRALVLTGKPFVFAAGADIGEFPPSATARAGDRGQPRRARAVRRGSARCPSRRSPRSTAPASAAASRSPCTATRARSRPSVRHFALPEVLPRDLPGLGRHAARAAARRHRDGRAVRSSQNPLRQNRMLDGAQGVRARVRGPAARAGRVPRRVDRLRARARRGRRSTAPTVDLADAPRSSAGRARSSTTPSTAPRRRPTRRST